ACAPAVFGSGHAGLLGHIGKRAVAVVVVENVVAKISGEEIVEAVVVVISDTTGLPPSGSGQASLLGYVGKGAVTIVAKQITGIAIPRRGLEASSVHQKNIEPAIVVVVKQRHAAAHFLEQK